jgi:hypothetical protein
MIKIMKMQKSDSAIPGKTAEPDFFAGSFYSVEAFDMKDPVTLEAFTDVPYFYTWELDRAIIIPNGPNQRLKFDVVPEKPLYERYFSGFLYKDGSFLGKIKFSQDAREPDHNVKGNYLMLDEDTVILRGCIDDSKGAKEYFWIHLDR